MKSIRFTTLLLLSIALPGLAETRFDAADAKAARSFLHGHFAAGDAGMVIVSGAVGWLMLQGLPLNPANLSMPVREVVGVGTALASDDQTGAVRISRVFPDSPAGKAGLSAGLLIRKINGASIEGRSLGDCMKMMGGRIGTKVRLDLLDPELNETRTVELTCQKFITSSGKPRS